MKGARKKMGISQGELARRANTTQATVSRIENGKITELKMQTAVDLAKALGLTPDFLVDWHKHQEEKCTPKCNKEVVE